jgi:hypothetical protein
MTRKSVILAAIFALLGALEARADPFFTDIATIQTATPPPGPGTVQPNVITISGVTSSAGELFTNTFGPGATAGTNSIVTVGVNLQATTGGFGLSGGGIATNTYNGNTVVAVFALASNNANPNAGGPGVFQATYNAGRAALFELTPAQVAAFKPGDPTTWGVVSGGKLNTPIAVFSLVPQQNVSFVAPGNGTGIFNLLQQQVNLSSVNLGTVTNLQSNFVLTVDNSLASTSKGTYITVQGVPVIPGDVVGATGIVTRADSALDLNPSSPDIATLNAIASQLGLLPSVDGVAGDSFASIGKGQPTDFVPAKTFADAQATGDFEESLGLTTAPGAFETPPGGNVPEPASVVLWSLMAGSAGLYVVVRRRSKKPSVA